MSRHERITGERERLYSIAHRYNGFSGMTMQDIDALERCAECSTPLLLIEHALDTTASETKDTRAMVALAQESNLPAWLVLYGASGTDCRCNILRRAMPGCDHGILYYRTKLLTPRATVFRMSTPRAYWQDVWAVHRAHHLLSHIPTDVHASRGARDDMRRIARVIWRLGLLPESALVLLKADAVDAAALMRAKPADCGTPEWAQWQARLPVAYTGLMAEALMGGLARDAGLAVRCRV